MDHEEYLGKNLAEIAAEKAAIIRPGVAAIIAPQTKEALAVLIQRSKAVKVELRFVGHELAGNYPLATMSSSVPRSNREGFHSVLSIHGNSEDGHYSVNFETHEGESENVLLGLRGRHQVTNAAVAVALAEELRQQEFAISSKAIKRGLETVRHAGRLEIWDTKPRMLFDGAHNPAAARALRDYLDEFVTEPITMIFGAMRDKALEEMASVLFPAAHEVVLTEIDNPRGASHEMLKSVVAWTLKPCRTHLASSPAYALQIATEVTGPDALICVTGSLYLVGAIQNAAKTGTLESSSAKA